MGAQIRDLRGRRGWSQRELAQRAGVSLRFLGQMETGVANVSLARLCEVAAALEVSLVTLLAGSGPVHDAVDQVAAELRTLGTEAQWNLLGRLGASRVRHVALVGLRGAGKSTVGARAAERLGCRFVVVDDEVRGRSGLALSDLFEMHGTTGYHRFCREVLREFIGHSEPAVLEIGGSVVADRECWELLDSHTRVLWLKASAGAHLQRVSAQGDTRPMEGFADATARLREILAVREPLYRRAHDVIDTERHGLQGTVDRVVTAAQSVTVADAGAA